MADRIKIRTQAFRRSNTKSLGFCQKTCLLLLHLRGDGRTADGVNLFYSEICIAGTINIMYSDLIRSGIFI